jgi:4-amino-4-deoxy-L-arabinose transferase-like glycosyltransferase
LGRHLFESSLKMMPVVRESRRTFIWLALIVVAALLPFLNKAFHVDDPLFIWMADQIRKHPLDPYGFKVNWAGFAQPMTDIMQNPPLCSYYIAAVISVLGSSEMVLHISFLPWAVISVLGTFALARRFCPNPFVAALLALFTPVFLISATTVMCDVMMLALWVWAIEFWLSGLDRQNWWRFLVSALLISAAVLTKYFAIALVPLLAAYTLFRSRRFTAQLAWLLVPVAVLSNYDFWSEQKYAHALFSGAISLSTAITSGTRLPRAVNGLIGLAFIGGCFFSVIFFCGLRNRRLVVCSLIGFLVFAAGFKFFVLPWQYLEAAEAPVWLEGGIFATIGVGILIAVVADFLRRRDSDALLLLLWIGGTLFFSTFLNWSVTSRTLLPAAPAVAILTIRQFKQPSSRRTAWSMAAAVICSLVLTISDYRDADCERSAANFLQQRYASVAHPLWFQGHWGFQYYMQQWGAIIYDRGNPQVKSGDLVAGAFSDIQAYRFPDEQISMQDWLRLTSFPFVGVSTLGGGASFYSSFGGPLPWIVNNVPPQRYYCFKLR